MVSEQMEIWLNANQTALIFIALSVFIGKALESKADGLIDRIMYFIFACLVCFSIPSWFFYILARIWI